MVSRISAWPLSWTVRALIAFLNVSIMVLVASSSDRLRSVLGSSSSTVCSNSWSLHEGFHLAVEHVVAADQAKVFHDRLRKIADHAAIVRNARRVENRRVRNFARGDVLEDDFALLLLAELAGREPSLWPSKPRPDQSRFLYSR